MMEYFYSEGGSNRPYFPHRFKVRNVTNEMHEWCTHYNSEGRSFRRWHIIFGTMQGSHDIVQFEWEQAALMFALKFGDYII